MKAMIFNNAGAPLQETELAAPRPGKGEVQLIVKACGVCRTDLHIMDGDLIPSRSPIILGHEIVGVVSEVGEDVESLKVGDRIGVPWLGMTCGVCTYCQSGRENLCDDGRFTGCDRHGGYAEMTVANARYCFPIPDCYSAAEAAPLLCAGLIGYRAYRAVSSAQRLGLYGFGAAAHIITQVARYEQREVYAFTRPADTAAQDFARELGSVWAGGANELPPVELDAAIIFAPAGDLLPAALSVIKKGASVICAGIHMTDIPAFPYRLLWQERVVRSVANLTRNDGIEFLELAPKVPVKTRVNIFPLREANAALAALREGRVEGAVVLEP